MEHLLVKPIHDQVLVRFEMAPRTTPAGVILPPDPKSEEYMRKAKILAMGKDAKDEDKEMQVKVGDRVYIPFNVGAEVERHTRTRYDNKEGQIKLLAYKDIKGVITTTKEDDKAPNHVKAMSLTEVVAKRDSKIIT